MLCLLCAQPEAADIHDETSPLYRHDPAYSVEHCSRCAVAPPRVGVCRVCGDPRELGFDGQHDASRDEFDHLYDPPPVQQGGGVASSRPLPESVDHSSGDSLAGAIPTSGAETFTLVADGNESSIPDQSPCGQPGCTIPRWRHVGYHHEWRANA